METNLEQDNSTNTPSRSSYQQLCSTAQVDPYLEPIDLTQFSHTQDLANKAMNERLAAALQVLLTLAVQQDQPVERVDKVMLDQYIGHIDQMIPI
jgi:predicted component of type VI protein secretion system